MSTNGQIAGGLGGAVIGFMTSGNAAGALRGFSIGMTIGSILDPVKIKTTEPKTSDLTVQTATYGAPIGRCYGTVSVAGNVFWIENNLLKCVVKKTKSGGKGGSKATVKTKTYYATFALGLIERPSTPLIAVRRIWVRGNLVYDASNLSQSAIVASNQTSALFNFHNGSLTQAADDRMQATLGIAGTSAYRGLAYLVFKDFPLAKYGNTLMGAQVKVEVIGSGTTGSYVQEYSTSNLTAIPWQSMIWTGKVFCMVGDNGGCAVSSDGLVWTQALIGGTSAWNWRGVVWNGKIFVAWNDGTYPNCRTARSYDGLNWTISGALSNPPWGIYTIGFHKAYFFALYGTSCATSTDGLTWTFASTIPVNGNWIDVAFNGSVWISAWGDNVITSLDGITWTGRSSVPNLVPSTQWHSLIWTGSFFLLVCGQSSGDAATSPDGVNWTSRPFPATTVGKGVCWTGEMFVAVGTNTVIWTSPDAITWTSKVAISAANGVGCCWNGAVVCMAYSNYSKAVVVYPHTITASNEALSSIVLTEILQSKILTVGDVSTASLVTTTRGYKVANIGAIRSALEALQGAWPFDIVQKGYVITCKPRGSASVATISASELSCIRMGDAMKESIKNSREMDIMLPRKVTVSHLDYDREYDVGEQYDERLNTDSVNIRRVELPIVMTSTEAVQTAQMLLYLYWLERYDISFSLPPTYLHLESGDVITVQANEATYQLRITSITYTGDGRLECEAKYNSASVYAPTAVGATGVSTGQVLTSAGTGTTVLMDLPCLQDIYDLAGFYAAIGGSSTAWPGAMLVSSLDAGQTWSDLQAFASPGSSIGMASNAIGAGRTDIIDFANVLTASFTNGVFSGVTEEAMFNGANYFAYGDVGRWEIISAKNMALQTSGAYLMSELLRGQLGTEWAMTLHVAGDYVVELNSSEAAFIASNTNSIGLAKIYRGVTLGETIDSESDISFTYNGMNLKPLSPVYLNGNRDASNNWSLNWIRRTRVGGAWRDNVDASLGETVEQYIVEFYSSAAYTLLKHTSVVLTTPAYTYPLTGAISQTTDFGGVQTTLYCKIYQLSAAVGRGTPLIMSITR